MRRTLRKTFFRPEVCNSLLQGIITLRIIEVSIPEMFSHGSSWANLHLWLQVQVLNRSEQYADCSCCSPLFSPCKWERDNNSPIVLPWKQRSAVSLQSAFCTVQYVNQVFFWPVIIHVQNEGLYPNKVKNSFAFSQKLGCLAHNSKMGKISVELHTLILYSVSLIMHPRYCLLWQWRIPESIAYIHW